MSQSKDIIKTVDINGKKYEVMVIREFCPLEFTIDVAGSITTPTQIKDNVLKFSTGYHIYQLNILAETNALAGLLLNINGKFYPSESYFLDATNDLAQKALGTYTKGFRATDDPMREYKLDIKIEPEGLLKFYAYNGHTSAQELYVLILGHRLFEKILNPIN